MEPDARTASPGISIPDTSLTVDLQPAGELFEPHGVGAAAKEVPSDAASATTLPTTTARDDMGKMKEQDDKDAQENLLPHSETAEEKEARLKAERGKRKIASLHAQINTAKAQIEDMERGIAEGKENLRNPNAQSTITRHITLLHEYNAIRDVGQGLMGLIADRKGVRIRDVYRDMGVAEGD